MTAIVVLTCARDDDEPFGYLGNTLAQIEAQRAPDVVPGDVVAGELVAPTVVCDSTSSPLQPDIPPGWNLHGFGRPPGTIHGNKWAYWEALRVALAAGTDAALVFEDDLDFAPNALRRMLTLPVPADCAFVMFFAPAALQSPRTFPGLHRSPAPVICTQAIKFTRATLAKLLDWQNSIGFQSFKESDQALELARAHFGWRYAAHCPELVQHVGATSAATPGEGLDWKFRVAQTYAGGMDTMRLYVRDELYR